MKTEQTIREQVAQNIIDHFQDWDAEASQLAQQHQDVRAYEHSMTQKLLLALDPIISKQHGITKAELDAMNHLVSFWNAYCELPSSDHEKTDVCNAIHVIQGLLAIRVARRANPEIWT